MTQSEKIEELRDDMLRTMDVVNSWIQQVEQLGRNHHDLTKKHENTSQLMSGVAAALAKLEEKIDSLKR